jgi:hypothetical protein
MRYHRDKRRGCKGGQAHIPSVIVSVLFIVYLDKRNSPEPDFSLFRNEVIHLKIGLKITFFYFSTWHYQKEKSARENFFYFIVNKEFLKTEICLYENHYHRITRQVILVRKIMVS